MSGLMSRTVVLTVSRLSNFAIHLLSPLLLVRILDVSAYGQYQEFMIYATMLTVLCAFAVDSSLTYFLPRYPHRESAFVSQTSAATLVISVTVLSILLLSKGLLLRIASYDFVAPLAAYTFFFVNLNWIEYFWIAKRQPRKVLYYSAVRLIIRVGTAVLVAYYSRDVLTIVWSLVVVEAVRVALVLVYFVKLKTFVRDFRQSELVEQLRFAGPIGASALVQQASRNIGKLFIGGTLGPMALAYYATGSYLQPLVRVTRSGIEDAVYPELVRAHNEPGGAVRLWQRVNVLNCALFFPASLLLIYYAEPIIMALFTSTYLPAAPIFCVYALYLIRRCFNTDVLLRTTGRSGFMLWGATGALVVNVTLIAVLSRTLGMIGPAIAFIIAELAAELYYTNRTLRALGVSLAGLADWGSILRIIVSCILALPIPMAFDLVSGHELFRAAVSSLLYLTAVLWLTHRLGVNDIGRVVGYLRSRLHGRAPR
jgi:O-antigen/teichoic acid export membrane protein